VATLVISRSEGAFDDDKRRRAEAGHDDMELAPVDLAA
jgi:hypothetical protein